MKDLYLDLPMTVTLGNKGSTNQYFIPCKENFTQLIGPGDAITFNINHSFEALYYKEQTTKDIVVGLVGNSETSMVAGTYDLSTSTFTENATSYTLIQNGKNIVVIGNIPYAEAIPSLGLTEGNRFIFRVKNPAITGRDELPDGIIAKVTNSLINGYNEYTQAAFEPDGTLVILFNVGVKHIEVMLKWTEQQTDFDIYTLDIEANLEPKPAA